MGRPLFDDRLLKAPRAAHRTRREGRSFSGLENSKSSEFVTFPRKCPAVHGHPTPSGRPDGRHLRDRPRGAAGWSAGLPAAQADRSEDIARDRVGRQGASGGGAPEGTRTGPPARENCALQLAALMGWDCVIFQRAGDGAQGPEQPGSLDRAG
jgi:hypothetical protein